MTITATEDAAQQGVIARTRPTYGYYRQPNGWLTVSPITELEQLHYVSEGWTRLGSYGLVEMTSVYMANHPFEPLFQRGGAKEMCREQIIESGFHLKPPMVPVCGKVIDQYHRSHGSDCWAGAQPVVFPQLQGETFSGLDCRLCDRKGFPTERARDQHESVMHKEEKGDIRTGKVLAESLVDGLGRAGVIGSEQAPTEHDYVCGRCAAGFDNLAVFGKHVKEH